MPTLRLLLLLFFLSQVREACPTVQELPLKLLNTVSSNLIYYYTEFRDSTDQRIAKYCEFVYHTIGGVFASDDADYLQRRVSMDPLMVFSIGICMNASEVTKEVIKAFMQLGRAVEDGNATRGFAPVMEDAIEGNGTFIAVLNLAGKRYAVKMPLKQDHTHARTSSFKIRDPGLQRYGVPDRTAKSSHEAKADRDPSRQLEMAREQSNIQLLMSKEGVLKDFVGVCAASEFSYPGDIVVMEYGGKTLDDYYKELRVGEAPAMTDGKRNALHVRLIDIATNLSNNGLTYCDLKPANILFDPDSPSQARLIDFGSLSEIGERCRVGTLRYAPPELNRARRYYNAFAKAKIAYGRCSIKQHHVDTTSAMLQVVVKELTSIAGTHRVEKHTSGYVFWSLAAEDRLYYENLLSYIKSRLGTTLDGDACKRLNEAFDAFTRRYGFNGSILPKSSIELRDSLYVDVHTLGVVILESELISAYYKDGLTLKDEKRRKEFLPHHLFGKIRTHYQDLKEDDLTVENLALMRLMLPEEQTNRTRFIINELNAAGYRNGPLLDYIASNVMTERSSRDTLVDFKQKYVRLNSKEQINI